jgi:polyisoprenoid-binding protein YceI
VLAVSPACKKDKKDPGKTGTPGSAATTPTPDPGSAAATPTPTPDPGSAAAAPTPTEPPKPAEDTADWIKVHATHFTANPADPVEVSFEKFKVVKATFDPAKIEGGTATIEIDLASLKTNDAKRDDHLKTPDYIDTTKNPTATINIGNVKKKDDKTYTADAKVKLRGVEKKYPVTFEVVEAKDDWIRIKGEHKFSRLDFKVGKKAGPDQKKDDGVAEELAVKLQLTLKKT